jgi:hypothetical protein
LRNRELGPDEIGSADPADRFLLDVGGTGMKKRPIVDFANPKWQRVDPDQLRRFEDGIVEKVVKTVNTRAAKQRDHIIKARTRLVR